jgi:alpha-glucuronidase
LDDAETWKWGCLLYFQTFSKMPIPDATGKPAHDLNYYEKLHLVDKRKLDSEK